MRPTSTTLDHAAAKVGSPPAAAAAGHAPRTRPWSGLGARLLALPRTRPELLALLVLAAILYLWALSRNGFANTYYSAAVRSMSTSWHDFLFASFDSGGLMTVDKPPLALWVQALSARVFGFDSWAILVPQALMGMASAALVYDLTRRRFGRPAGFVAGFVLVLTPITVAISRHNNPDALLVLCSVAALWLFVRGLEDGRTRWLVLSGVAVGLGFETKMAVALIVVPGIAAAWLWIAPRRRGRLDALRQLLVGGFAMVVVGVAWPVAVWLTPAADRPWVGSSSDNSIWSLILGYNGIGRLDGQAGGPGGGGPGGGGGGGVFGGDAGPLRLLNAALGGQVGWLLGMALVGAVGLLVLTRLRRSDPRTGWLIAVGGAFAASAIAFSFAQGIFHPYYVSLLAPFSAALVGAAIGVVLQGGRAARVLGPLAVAGGVITSLAVIDAVGDFGWLAPLLVAGGIVAAAALALPGTLVARRLRVAALAAIVGLLLIAPGAWAFGTLGHATSGTFPAGGPADAAMGRGGPGGGRFGGGGPGGFTPPGGSAGSGSAGSMPAAPPSMDGSSGSGSAGSMPGLGGSSGGGSAGGPPSFGGGMGGGPGQSQSLTEALAYVEADGGGTIGVSSQQGAANAIIQSGADVAGIGGFSGRESEVSIAWLADAVADGRISWVIADSTGGGGMPNDGRTGSGTVMEAVQQVGTETSVDGLYDLRGKADALRALA